MPGSNKPKIDQVAFYDRLKKAIDASLKFHGCNDKAAAAGGRSGHYLSMVLEEKTEPGFFFVAQLSHELGISMNYLSGITNEPFDITTLTSGNGLDDETIGLFDQISTKLRRAALKRGEEPSFHDVLRLWHKHGKSLHAFSDIIEWFDIYEVPSPDDVGLHAERMGASSLAARTLGKADLSLLQFALDNVADEDLTNSLLHAYKEAATGKPVLTEEVLNVFAPGHEAKIQLEYLRLLIRVTDHEGAPRIMSYSQAFG